MKSLFNQPAQCYRYATESAGVKRFQKLLVYDLDRRDDSTIPSARRVNGVDGDFKGNTAYFLKELMKKMRSDEFLCDSTIPATAPVGSQHLLRHVGKWVM